MQIFFELFKETPGALRYQEVDQSGTPIPKDEISIGTLYLRKRAFPHHPKQIVVTITEG